MIKTTKYIYKEEIFTVKDYGAHIKNQKKQLVLQGEASGLTICSELFFENNFKLV